MYQVSQVRREFLVVVVVVAALGALEQRAVSLLLAGCVDSLLPDERLRLRGHVGEVIGHHKHLVDFVVGVEERLQCVVEMRIKKYQQFIICLTRMM